jgi:peptidylprolyl isomerase
MFASSVKRGAPTTFRVNEAMPGWAEGLQLMVVGEKRRLWIPQQLAYEGKPDQPQGPLVLDVELLQLAPGTRPIAPPPDLSAPPPGAEHTPSGLIHRLLRAATSDKRPAPYDRVRIAYAGWSSDGHMIDSSQARGDDVVVAVSYGFPGWREALQLMREGEQRRFWIPEQLASRSYPVAVPGTLVFDIELRQVISMPSPPPVPEDVSAPPVGAVRTRSGLVYRVLRKGTGTRKPDLESTVEVHYSYWTSDGRLLDSTIPGGAPHRAELEDGDLPPGLTEAVQLMVVGEKRRLWVPPGLGFSDKGRPRNEPLVFDLELFALYDGKVEVEWVEPKQP